MLPIGGVGEAWRWLGIAADQSDHKTIRKMALRDDDLSAIHDQLTDWGALTDGDSLNSHGLNEVFGDEPAPLPLFQRWIAEAGEADDDHGIAL